MEESETPLIALHLYVIDDTPASHVAAENLRHLLGAELAGLYRLEIVDLREHPEAARQQDIIAVPVLIRGERVARLVGSMGDSAQVIAALQIDPE